LSENETTTDRSLPASGSLSGEQALLIAVIYRPLFFRQRQPAHRLHVEFAKGRPKERPPKSHIRQIDLTAAENLTQI
jgi:hypothetical protein